MRGIYSCFAALLLAASLSCRAQEVATTPIDNREQGALSIDAWHDLLNAFYHTPDVPADTLGADDMPNWEFVSSSAAGTLKKTWNGWNLTIGPSNKVESIRIIRKYNLNTALYAGLRFGGEWNSQAKLNFVISEDLESPSSYEFRSSSNPKQSEPAELFDVPLKGTLLKKIELEVTVPPRANTVVVSPTFILAKRKIINRSLDNPIAVPAVKDRLSIVEKKLRWGLVLKAGDLKDFRNRLQQGDGKDLLLKQQEVIDPYLKEDVVAEFNEASRGQYLRLSAHEYEGLDRWRWKLPPNIVMTDAAMIYLATSDVRYAELARQILLCICRTKYWSNSFIFRFPLPEESKSYAPFVEAEYAMDVALTMDWISDYLTEEEVKESQFALLHKAVPNIKSYFQKHASPKEFWRTSNQGLIFSGGLLMASVVQDKKSDENQKDIADSLTRLDEVFGRISAPDGSLHEGLGYWQVSLVFGTIPLMVAANLTDKPFPGIYEESLFRQFEFAAYCKSNASLSLRSFNFSDSRYLPVPGSPMVFSLVAKCQSAAFLLKSYAKAGNRIGFFDPQFNQSNLAILSGVNTDAIPDDVLKLPLQKTFPDSQIVFWRGGWNFGDSNFTFISGPIYTGHHHAGKNSFTLEYGGERLFIDPGMLSYNDSRGKELQRDAFHNTVSIGEQNQLTYATSTGAMLIECQTGEINHLVSDATPLYAGAEKVVRNLYYSDKWKILVCIDDVILRQAGKVLSNVQTLMPFQKDISQPGVWSFQGSRSQVKGMFTASTGECQVQQDTFVCDSGDLYRLRYGLNDPVQKVRLIGVFAFDLKGQSILLNHTIQEGGRRFEITREAESVSFLIPADPVDGVPLKIDFSRAKK